MKLMEVAGDTASICIEIGRSLKSLRHFSNHALIAFEKLA